MPRDFSSKSDQPSMRTNDKPNTATNDRNACIIVDPTDGGKNEAKDVPVVVSGKKKKTKSKNKASSSASEIHPSETAARSFNPIKGDVRQTGKREKFWVIQ